MNLVGRMFRRCSSALGLRIEPNVILRGTQIPAAEAEFQLSVYGRAPASPWTAANLAPWAPAAPSGARRVGPADTSPRRLAMPEAMQQCVVVLINTSDFFGHPQLKKAGMATRE